MRAKKRKHQKWNDHLVEWVLPFELTTVSYGMAVPLESSFCTGLNHKMNPELPLDILAPLDLCGVTRIRASVSGGKPLTI